MKAMKMKLAIPLLIALVYGSSPALATPLLGSDLASFTVLGATTVTNVSAPSSDTSASGQAAVRMP
jgi:hypothetical protein